MNISRFSEEGGGNEGVGDKRSNMHWRSSVVIKASLSVWPALYQIFGDKTEIRIGQKKNSLLD